MSRLAAGSILDGLGFFAQHWLGLANASFALISALAIVAPFLLGRGLPDEAGIIYRLYSNMCHQLDYRSYFLFGHQMAYCQRDFAILLSLFLAGVAYAVLRRRIHPLNWRLYLLVIAPMAVDGFTQLFGWRESNWELRTLTGALFGVASVWFLYPHVDASISELSDEASAIRKRISSCPQSPKRAGEASL